MKVILLTLPLLIHLATMAEGVQTSAKLFKCDRTFKIIETVGKIVPNNTANFKPLKVGGLLVNEDKLIPATSVEFALNNILAMSPIRVHKQNDSWSHQLVVSLSGVTDDDGQEKLTYHVTSYSGDKAYSRSSADDAKTSNLKFVKLTLESIECTPINK